MKNLLLVLCLVILLGCSVHLVSFKQVYEYESQKIEYNPEKAHAEIVQRVNAPKGLYAEYTNHHYYIIDDGRITVLDDINNHKTKKEISYNWRQYYNDSLECTYKVICGNGIMEHNNKITFMLTLEQRYLSTPEYYTYYNDRKIYYKYPLFSVDSDGTNFCMSDITVDIASAERMDGFYYDNDEAMLWVILYRSYDTRELHRYKYNSMQSHFVRDDYTPKIKYDFGQIYLTKNKITDVFYCDNRRYDWISSILTVFTDYNAQEYQTVWITSLGLSDKPLSSFCDEDAVWLYVTDGTSDSYPDGHYEFLKIKCLGDVYSVKE